MWKSALLLLAAAVAWGQDLPKGQIVDSVKCTADASQSYALYLPSNYSPDRKWSLVIAFDPNAQGRRPVERFQAAAEQYGYIVAGSNNSKNGPPMESLLAAQVMAADLLTRFSVNDKRVYTAGLSGGARVAMKVAIDAGQIAGVIASSAGFPPGEYKFSVPFAIFGTAGTEDFNYLEMRQLDHSLSSPHRIIVFNGGHTWLSSDLAGQALSWMEVQAMKSGRKERDPALLDKIFAARAAQVDAEKNDVRALVALNALTDDFDGLKDVSKYSARAAELRKKPGVSEALKKEQDDDQHEAQADAELAELQNGLSEGTEEEKTTSLTQLKQKLPDLAKQANSSEDSPDRRMARRLLAGVLADAHSIENPEYQKLITELRRPDPR